MAKARLAFLLYDMDVEVDMLQYVLYSCSPYQNYFLLYSGIFDLSLYHDVHVSSCSGA
jgi:hypothetical protein